MPIIATLELNLLPSAVADAPRQGRSTCMRVAREFTERSAVRGSEPAEVGKSALARNRCDGGVRVGQELFPGKVQTDFTEVPGRVVYTDRIVELGAIPSAGTVGDSFDCQSVSARSRKDGVVLAGVF